MNIVFKKFFLINLYILPLFFFSLAALNSFSNSENSFFIKQLIWILISFGFASLILFINFQFLKKDFIALSLYLLAVLLLILLLIFGTEYNNAKSWFDFGFFLFQPVELIKLILIIVLAKFFAQRHIEKSFNKIFFSGLLTFIFFVLIFLQPDFGSASIIFFLWVFIIFFSRIYFRHILLVASILLIGFFILWNYLFLDFQKQRFVTFINPTFDIQGGGYNVYQSKIAIGSGGLTGLGLGQGKQSELNFLPEKETDFIFASIAEEFGFIGVFFLFSFFFLLIFALIKIAIQARGNFEKIFIFGVASMFVISFILNIGSNLGILPVTGLALPFISYGGSHLFFEYVALAISISLGYSNNNLL